MFGPYSATYPGTSEYTPYVFGTRVPQNIYSTAVDLIPGYPGVCTLLGLGKTRVLCIRYTLGYSVTQPDCLGHTQLHTRVPPSIHPTCLVPGYPRVYTLLTSTYSRFDTRVPQRITLLRRFGPYSGIMYSVYSGVPGYQTRLFGSYSVQHPGTPRVVPGRHPDLRVYQVCT